MKTIIRINGLALALIVLCLVFSGATAQAQNDGGQGDQVQTRKEAGDLDRDRDRDQDRTNQYSQSQEQIRKNMKDRVDQAPGLTAQEREAMRANVDECLQLGISGEGMDALFPGEQTRSHLSAQTMLRLQKRVIEAAREGLPVEPVTTKLQEGRTKGVPEQRLEQACVRMENNVRTANQIMNQAMEDGLEPPDEPAQNRHMKGEMAQQMWRGMNEEGYEQLREQARKRLHDGQCGVEDLVSAGELATRLMESGVERNRATNFAGDALQQGYSTQEMRQLQLMVAAHQQKNQSMNQFMGDMEHCVGAGMGAGEMYNYMMRHGWMGPGDMYGPGGYDPMEHKGMGGQQGEGGGHGGHGDGGGSGNG
ncbi:MAG: hypothetical protein PVF33_00410 [Candidatus Latescibacterota bacterium]|jgi:hypothetical protein